MHTIDIILAVIGLTAVITGFIRGFVRQLGSAGALIAGIVVCRLFGDDVAGKLSAGAEHPALMHAVAYALLFLGAYLIVSLVAMLLHKLLSAMKLGLPNRLAGALLQLGIWGVLASLAINIYIAAVPGDSSAFDNPQYPWRKITAEIAPALMGYINNQNDR